MEQKTQKIIMAIKSSVLTSLGVLGLPAVSFIIMAWLTGCTTSPIMHGYQDPFADAFRDKGLKYVISFNANDSSILDSLTFDAQGHVIRRKGFFLDQRMSYDSLNFLTRKLDLSDVPHNYFVRYYSDGEDVIQEWNEINHLKWSFDRSEILQPSFSVRFKLDQDGKVISEIDTFFNQLTKLKYDSNDKLKTKEVYSLDQKNRLYRYNYMYDAANKIKKISIQLEDNQEPVIHFFTNGLLDSTIEKGQIIKYKYLY